MTLAPEYTSEYLAQRDALALIITNAYRARHGMPPVRYHAAVDEDIANAILHAGWTAPTIHESPYTDDAKLDLLNEALEHGVGSTTSARAKQVRNVALEIMEKHQRQPGIPHNLCAKDGRKVWPCLEYQLAKDAFIYAGGILENVEAPF